MKNKDVNLQFEGKGVLLDKTTATHVYNVVKFTKQYIISRDSNNRLYGCCVNISHQSLCYLIRAIANSGAAGGGGSTAEEA